METIDIEIRSNAQETGTSIKDLKEEIKELRQEMESAAIGSDEYNDALNKLADSTAKLKNEQDALKGSTAGLQGAFDGITGLSRNIVAGYGAIKGAQALMNEETRKGMSTSDKFLAVLMLMQGLQGMKGFNNNLGKVATGLKGFTGSVSKAGGIIKFLGGKLSGVSKIFTSLGAAIGVSGAALAAFTGAAAAVVGVLAIISKHNANVKVAALTSEFNRGEEAIRAHADALQKDIDALEDDGASEVELADATLQATLALYDENEELIRQKEILKGELQSRHKVFISWLNGEKAALEEVTRELEVYYTRRKELGQQAQDNEYALTRAERREKRRTREEAARTAKQAAAERERERERELAAAKAAAEAEAKAQMEAIEKVRKAWQEYLDDLILQFSNTTGAITTALSSMSGLSIEGPNVNINTPGDIDAFLLLYGVSSQELKDKLRGSLLGLLYDTNKTILESNADVDQKLAAQDELRQKALQVLSSKLVETALATRIEISDVYNELGEHMLHFEQTIPIYTSGALDAAKEIPIAFQKQFESIKKLYNDGIITESEYRASLLNIEKEYQDTVLSMTKELADNTTLTEEQKQAVIYELNRKPLEFAKDVYNELKETWDNMFNEFKVQAETAASATDVAYQNATDAVTGYEAAFATSMGKIKEGQQAWLAEKDKQIQALTELKNAIKGQLEFEQLTNDQRIYLLQELDAAEAQLAAAQHERAVQEAQDRADNFKQYVDYAQQYLSATADLFGSIADIYTAKSNELKQKAEAALAKGKEGEAEAKRLDKLAEEEFNKSKNLQIAQAIITGAGGVASAIATAMQLGPIAGPILGAINAAAVVASTIAQIKAIENTKYSPASGSNSSSAPVDTSFTLTSPDAYQNTLSDETQSDLQANAHQNQRVYVVSSDISDAQNNEKTTVTTATF